MKIGKNFETDFEDYGVTEPVNSAGDGYGVTEPVNSAGGYGPTLPPDGMGGEASMEWPSMDWRDNVGYTSGVFSANESMDPTLPPEHGNDFETGDFKRDSGVEVYDDATRPVVMGGMEGFTPVVGWLVCIDGPSKGADYRLRPGYNYIGRSEHMDVCIKGDNEIGRERHAMVAYDQEERVFFFGPVDGKSTVRLNGKMVMVPSELHANDTLKIGSTQLMFVPLCGERFNWDV